MKLREHPGRVTALGIVIGAAVGLGVAALVYIALAAVLEEAGPLEELQGFAWNLVPLGTIAGGGLGWWAADRWRRRGGS